MTAKKQIHFQMARVIKSITASTSSVGEIQDIYGDLHLAVCIVKAIEGFWL